MTVRARIAKVLRCQGADYARHANRECRCTRSDRRAYYSGDAR